MRILKSSSKKYEAVQFDVDRPEVTADQDGVAVAVIVRNEEAAIAEWLAFHRAAGVNHFIFYDDGCTDDTVPLARRVLGQDQLTVLPWNQRLRDAKAERALHSQGLAFAHAVANFVRYRWICFIDVDEFLYPTEADGIDQALAEMDHAECIYVRWEMFGRQGFATTPNHIIPNFTLRYRDPITSPVKGVFNFKCIVNPARVSRAYVHGFLGSDHDQIWSAAGKAFRAGQKRTAAFCEAPRLRLNHYYAKSDAQLAEKIGKGSIGESVFTKAFKSGAGRQDLLMRRVLEIERDTVEDRGIIDYCARIGFDPAK
ncbi:MAG: glycosyltransferase family 92 protein [Pseudomonadota bacterium]